MSLADIKRRGVLRACYALDDYPSAFFNKSGDLVGFDVEMAHQFARGLNVALEFVPVRSLTEGGGRVNTRYCDVFMSLLPITPELTELASMTAPVRRVPVGLIVWDHRRQRFQTWAGIREMKNLRIVVSDSPAVVHFLEKMLPHATAVVSHAKLEFDRLLSAGLPGADAIMVAAEEGAAWTILHPHFNLVS